MMISPLLLRVAARERNASALTVGLQVAATATFLPQAWFLAAGLTAMVSGDTATLLRSAGAILGLVLVRGLLTWSQARAAARLGSAVRVRLRDEALTGALVPSALHDARRRDGALRATLVDGVDGVDTYVTRYLPAVAQVLILIPLVVALLFAVHPVAAAAAGLAAVVAVLAPLLWRKVLVRRSSTHWDTYEGLGSDLLESLRGMTTLRVLGETGVARARITERSDALHRATVRVMRTSLFDTAIIDLAVQGGTLAAVVLATTDALASGDRPATAYLVLLLSGEVFRPVRDLARAWHAGYLGTSAAPALAALGAGVPPGPHPGGGSGGGEPSAAGAGSAARTGTGSASAAGDASSAGASGDSRGGRTGSRATADLVIEGVTFGYPGAGRAVLRDVHATFPVGTVTAVVGPSGAGKSTLLDLVLGHLAPGTGRVHRGGLPVGADDVALVAQRPVLFEGSLRENLTVGRPAATDAEIRDACAAAGVLDEVLALPDGLDTRVATAGSTLSGGQRQRIALARAILSERPVLLADEPTSALDPAAARTVTRTLARLGADRVVVVVAHRPESLDGVSRVLELHDGALRPAPDSPGTDVARRNPAPVGETAATAAPLSPGSHA
ncbi:ABC transporter ATP-binding protein/permease [Myceligenerans xiligouense]|uniref:ABC-type transport system involved in cytochrome bd biosynthesis fused ATPase/permease subunit n=1 Tax=Myceligenerans xiligouense TaxID=253184 RepID=A0A3N4YMQ8_9MICO|nr:ATP-binding cassette domain-containing protein [Myceligenerans xiligouense]RPF20614.1 ABC-type transport system involved in cytochrome bd biosynthesis fused ATPase/permease subunit [Myceligenerans xiligouense]